MKVGLDWAKIFDFQLELDDNESNSEEVALPRSTTASLRTLKSFFGSTSKRSAPRDFANHSFEVQRKGHLAQSKYSPPGLYLKPHGTCLFLSRTCVQVGRGEIRREETPTSDMRTSPDTQNVNDRRF
ncbi:hypothetical protein OG21DRAFT_1215346 [Imleria badia]|nr:hypothetical protein OG21DRAFT_1215346 [Imleria badia]